MYPLRNATIMVYFNILHSKWVEYFILLYLSTCPNTAELVVGMVLFHLKQISWAKQLFPSAKSACNSKKSP